MRRFVLLTLLLLVACGDSPAPEPAPVSDAPEPAPRYRAWTYESEEVRELALALPDPAALDRLFEMATSTVWADHDAFEAMDALGAFGGEAAANRAGNLLASPDLPTRRAAARILAGLGEGARGQLEVLLRVAGGAGEFSRERAASALAAIGEPAFRALVEALESEKFRRRRVAVEALPRFGERAVPALLRALADPDLRSRALEALRPFGAEAVAGLPVVRECLRAEDPFTRYQAAMLLGAMGEGAREAVPDLVGLLDVSDGIVRKGAATALGGIGMVGPGVVDGLVERLADEERDVASQARQALIALGPAARAAAPAVAARIDEPGEMTGVLGILAAIDPDPDVALPAIRKGIESRKLHLRTDALEAFAAVAPADEAARLLLRFWEEDAYEDVRKSAGRTLASLGEDAATVLPDVLERFDGTAPGEDLHREIHSVLAAMGPAAVPALSRLVADLERGCVAAARTLGRIGEPALPALRRFAKEGDSRVRLFSLRALVRVEPDAAQLRARLVGALRDPSSEVREEAAKLLGERGPSAAAAEEAIAARLEDPDEFVRREAVLALAEIGCAPRATAWLARELERAGPGERFDVIHLLGRVAEEDPAAVGILKRVFEEGGPRARRAAAGWLVELDER